MLAANTAIGTQTHMQLKSSFVADGACKQSGWSSKISSRVALVACAGVLAYLRYHDVYNSSQSRAQDSGVEGSLQYPVAELDTCDPEVDRGKAVIKWAVRLGAKVLCMCAGCVC